MYGICSVFFYRQQGVYKIVCGLFLANLIVYSIKKCHESVLLVLPHHGMLTERNRVDTLNIHF